MFFMQVKVVSETVSTYFYKKHSFWLQPQCFLTFSEIQPKMFLR